MELRKWYKLFLCRSPRVPPPQKPTLLLHMKMSKEYITLREKFSQPLWVRNDDTCYGCQVTLAKYWSNIQLNTAPEWSSCAIAISKWKRKNKQIRTEHTHTAKLMLILYLITVCERKSVFTTPRAKSFVVWCCEKRSQSSIIVASLIMCFSFSMSNFFVCCLLCVCVLLVFFWIYTRHKLPKPTRILLHDFSFKYCNKEQIIKMSDEKSFKSKNVVVHKTAIG